MVEIRYEGGFATPEMTFSRAPLLLITGDGRVIYEGPVPAIYPGPLLPNLLERTITEDGIQTLLAKADELGLLAEADYARNDQIADAPDTVVKITVDGTTYTHSAYALGFDGETDAGRANLFEFVTAATDLAGTVGEDELGPEATLASDTYLVRATPIDPATVTTEVPATIVDWPADASVTPRRRGRVRRVAGRRGRHVVRRRQPAHVLHRGWGHLPGGGDTRGARFELLTATAPRRSGAPRHAPSCGTPLRRRRVRSPR